MFLHKKMMEKFPLRNKMGCKETKEHLQEKLSGLCEGHGQLVLRDEIAYSFSVYRTCWLGHVGL